MKIGILTYHRAHNYGAMLQAYALQHFLQFWTIIPKIAVIFGITLVYIKKKQYLCALNC